jgi:hypothetical protein
MVIMTPHFSLTGILGEDHVIRPLNLSKPWQSWTWYSSVLCLEPVQSSLHRALSPMSLDFIHASPGLHSDPS